MLVEWAVRRRSAWELPEALEAPGEWAAMQVVEKAVRARARRPNSTHRAIVRLRNNLVGERLQRSWVSGPLWACADVSVYRDGSSSPENSAYQPPRVLVEKRSFAIRSIDSYGEAGGSSATCAPTFAPTFSGSSRWCSPSIAPRGPRSRQVTVSVARAQAAGARAGRAPALERARALVPRARAAGAARARATEAAGARRTCARAYRASRRRRAPAKMRTT